MGDSRYLPTSPEGKLYKLAEEMGEVLQVIRKIGRHGWATRDPYTGISYNNSEDLLRELRDLKQAIDAVERIVP